MGLDTRKRKKNLDFFRDFDEGLYKNSVTIKKEQPQSLDELLEQFKAMQDALFSEQEAGKATIDMDWDIKEATARYEDRISQLQRRRDAIIKGL